LAALESCGIDYLIVGGIAVGFYSEPRFTKDLDVLVAVRPPGDLKLIEALRVFGAPVHLVKAEDFAKTDFVFHFGSPPWRIDILTSIPGIEFAEAFARRVSMPLGPATVNCISREDLIRAKKASGRHQDLADVEKLED
jgi:hypothetical protein